MLNEAPLYKHNTVIPWGKNTHTDWYFTSALTDISCKLTFHRNFKVILRVIQKITIYLKL